MRPIGRLGAGIAGIGALVACCALGPAAILAGLGVAAAGLGLGAWIAVAVGILIAAAGARLALARGRAGRSPACALRPPVARIDGSHDDPTASRARAHEQTGSQ
jgi:hypothetical protein